MEHVFWYSLLALLGASIGSFITMLVHRLHEHISFVRGRSRCPACDATLRWFELIPIVSFILLRRKCARCRQVIPMRYVLIEVGTTILFLLVGYFWSIAGTLSILELVRDLVLVSVVVFVAAYDGLYMEVDPWVTLGGGVVVGILTLFIMPSIWLSLVWGIALGVGWFALQYVVSHGRWVGGGDMFIGFLMGASLGLGRTVVALGVAYIVGASYALGVLSVGQKKRGDEIAFGTFLSLGMVVALFWGNDMLGWYLGLIK